MICPACDLEIKPEEEKTMIGNDRPYFNIYFHKSCFDTIYPEIEEHKELWLPRLKERYENSLKKHKK